MAYQKQADQQFSQKRRKRYTVFPYHKPRRVYPMLAETGSKEDLEREDYWVQWKLRNIGCNLKKMGL